MRQSPGRDSKVETEARPYEAEARPSQLKNCLEDASSRGRCLEDFIPDFAAVFTDDPYWNPVYIDYHSAIGGGRPRSPMRTPLAA